MGPNRKQILYDGYFYDVTDFIKRHPGGATLLEYHTTPGEDSTIPIQQFHNRNFKRVADIMKSFKRRRADDDDPSSDISKVSMSSNPLSARNKALTADYFKLFRELQAEGLFDPSYAHVAYRLAEPVTFVLLGVYILNNWGTSIWGFILGCMFVGMAKGRGSWTMHEAAHRSLTGTPNLDKYLASMLMGLTLGISGAWWREDHPQHHAMTNRLHRDVDLHLDPLMVLNEAMIEKKPNFFNKYQKYFLPLNGVIMMFYWKIYHTGTTLLRNPSLSDIFWIGLHYYLSWSYLSLPAYLLATTFNSWYLYGHFGLSHTFLPVRDEACHWVEAALCYTANIQHTPVVDWWMGYLNYQVEHHLFPTMPEFRHPRIVGRVKALAAKHGLPYHLYGYWEAIVMMSKNVNKVEHKMRSL